MSERMIITDVSRMHTGACIAGYSDDLSRPIRPVLAQGGGFEWEDLCVARGALLAPFNVVEIDFGDPRPSPPHAEDVLIREPLNIAYVGRVPRDKIPVALDRLAFDSVNAAFGEVSRGRSIAPGKGERSLATIRATSVEFITIDVHPSDQTLRVRVDFRDGAGNPFNLPVTDIGFRSYCHTRLVNRGQSPGLVGARIREQLNSSTSLYLRVGASRPFQPGPGHPEACYLLVTGIYSIPEYRTIPWTQLFPEMIPVDGTPLPEAVASRMGGVAKDPSAPGPG